jgi:hypothetical protein
MATKAPSVAAVIGATEVAYRRVLRALRSRRRYRYVRPEVRARDDGFVVVSPCCSRNVDPQGGVIDIAWIEPLGTGWRLHHRDHASGRWSTSAEGPLPRLLELLCADPERLFWP